ncbi:MAG: twin-arginine translocase TatA/TatE family subunit [Bacteroidetes bacterium]|nr:twin-arginine translocase TatA/TatE family subunit [Bacteroidota bacterium]
MGSLGPLELLVIFLIILLVFGAKRIPEIARGMGKGIREFRSATREITEELRVDDPPRIQPPRQPQQATTSRSEAPAESRSESQSAPAQKQSTAE